MTSQISCPRDLSDGDLLAEVERAVACERLAVSRLIALLMEVDSRKLYAGQGYSSLFTYCMQVLHLSEHAAYLRIEAARAARRFPAILEKLADGSLHLTAVSLLAPHLTDASHVQLLDAATHMSKRDVEHLIAQLRPQPDVPSIVRKLPVPASPPAREVLTAEPTDEPVPSVSIAVAAASRPLIKPLAPERYKVQFTVSHETHEKLRRVQDLMRHTIPSGDPSGIFDRALTLLLADLLKAKCGAAERPQRRVSAARITSTKPSYGPARSVCRRPKKRERILARCELGPDRADDSRDSGACGCSLSPRAPNAPPEAKRERDDHGAPFYTPNCRR